METENKEIKQQWKKATTEQKLNFLLDTISEIYPFSIFDKNDKNYVSREDLRETINNLKEDIIIKEKSLASRVYLLEQTIGLILEYLKVEVKKENNVFLKKINKKWICF